MDISLQVAIIVYVALFFNFFMVASFDNLGPRLAASHGISLETLSVIQAVKSFVNMGMGPVFALSSAKLPTTLLFPLGSLALVATYVAIAFATSEAGFFAGRVLSGIGASALTIGGMSVLMRCVPTNKRGKYTAIAYSAAGHSPLVAPVLSGLMYDRLGQTWTFLIPGIATLASAAVSYVLLMRAVAVPKLTDSPESRIQSMRKSDIWTCVKLMCTNPMSFVVLVGVFSAEFSFGSSLSTLPAILTNWDNGRLEVLIASLVYSIGPLTFTICAPISGWFVDRVGHYKVMIFGLSLLVIFFPLFQLLDDTLAGLSICIGLSFGMNSIVEVAVYPSIAAIVESTNIPHADVIGYAIGNIFSQGGYALGNLAGRRFYDWGGMLAMGLFNSGLDALVLIISIFIMYKFHLPSQTKINTEACKESSLTVNPYY